MTTQTTHEPVALWFERDLPARLVWSCRRWRVSDTPTELRVEPAVTPAFITHPPRRFVGWRFQATDDDGTTHMFEVVLGADGGWVLGRVYD